MSKVSATSRGTSRQAELSGKTAVVTGASSGIGRAIAVELASAGANVAVHANLNRKCAMEVADEISTQGCQSTVLVRDLSNPTCVGLVDEAWSWRGHVDIWINNAGVDVLTTELARLPFERRLEKLWEVDVRATVLLARAAGDRMKATGGVILNMGWDQATVGMSGDSGQMFAATKGAVMSFSRSLAQSLAPNVRVNCLAPGWIKTKWGDQASSSWQTRAKEESLVGRWGKPEDVAKVARFLAGPGASFVNGQILPINGGFRTGPMTSA